MRQRLCVLIICAVAIMGICCELAFAGGLNTRFIEAKLENLKMGKTYSVKEMTGQNLSLNNGSEDKTIDISIDVEKPAAYTLVKGYKPMPDTSWVLIANNSFKEVKPGESRETDILITIPKDQRYCGKKYQFYIYSHTAGNSSFRVGVMSRVLISIDKSRVSKR